MAWYPYSYKTAFDPATMSLAPVGSLGQVYAIGDTGFSTPLTTYDLSGLPLELAVQNDAGYIPNFQVEDQTSVIWKSGEYVLELPTSMPLPGPSGARIVNAADNGDGTMSFTLSDGSNVGPVTIPEGPEGPRGPAGYNATGAVEDQQTLADYIKATAGSNPVSRALTSSFVPATGHPPLYLDSYGEFFLPDGVWVPNQGTAATTLSADASIGSNTLTVTSGAGLLDGVVLVIEEGTPAQQQYKITTGGGTNTLTVEPAIANSLTAGTTVTPLWSDPGHLSNPAGWTAFAHWLANREIDGEPVFTDPGDQPIVIFGNSWTVSAFQDIYADAFHARFPSATVLTRGVGGDKSSDLLARFDTDVPTDAAYVVINEPGVNDCGSGIGLVEQTENLVELVERIKALGAIPVVTGAVPLQEFPASSLMQKHNLDQAFSVPGQFPAVTVAALDKRFSESTLSGATAYGAGALAKDTGGTSTAVGQLALAKNTTGGANSAFGQYSLAVNETGNSNTGVGQGTLSNCVGNDNTAIGARAAQLLTSANNTTAVGVDAVASASVTGNHNTGIGKSALAKVTSGSANTGIGRDSGGKVTTGAGNVAIGASAAHSPDFNPGNGTTTANNQTVIGSYAGQATATQNDGATAIGNSALVGADGATAIGHRAKALHVGSVAVGDHTETSADNQAALGPRALFLEQIFTEPATPTGGGVLWVQDGALKFKGTAGTVTTVAPA